ncbi:MAG TPA: hypothetical protein VKM55_29900 [Candidatus Lokiarchaeia archaeon]|nr:hypothetical protein [Candidatus Lokiarchaeia archaeon]
MTLPVTKAKRANHAKSSNDKGLLDFTDAEKAPVVDTDATERVLAVVKGLKENYEQHYAEIESRVKKCVESPIKTFTMDDGMPIVMQLSVWDTKLGPVTAMMVGDADLLVSIPADELDASTRMIDVLAPGNTCDMSSGDLGRLMVKFSIADPAVRGGEVWLLIVAYHDLAIDVLRVTIRELLAQTAVCWHDDVALAEEAIRMRDNFDVAKSRWLMYLTELRRSIWGIVEKSREVLPERPFPNVDISSIAEALEVSRGAPAESELEQKTIEPAPEPKSSRSKNEPRKYAKPEQEERVEDEPEAFTTTPAEPEKAIPGDDEETQAPVPIRLLPARPTSMDSNDAPATQSSTVPGKQLPPAKPIEPAIIDVLGKLQRSGNSVKVDKTTLEATALRLVELEPGKGGLIALAYSFRAAFLPFPVIHVIDGSCYAGDDRATIEVHRPETSDVLHDHLPASEEVLFRGKLYGRVHQDRALKPVTVPIVLVRHAIKGADGDMPFCWIEPVMSGTRGYFLVVAGEIDTFDGFIMNALRVLGPRMADAEAAHVITVTRDIKQTNIAGRGIAILVFTIAIAGILASCQWLPIATTVTILQYWYVLVAGLVSGLLVLGYVYHGLDFRVSRAIGARALAVTARTPFLIVPGWEDIVPAARRIGKALFPRFKAAFCQDLDGTAIDEATEVVFRQDDTTKKPATSKAFSELHALAAKTKVEPDTPASAKVNAPEPREHLPIHDARAPRRRSDEEDILDDATETGDGAGSAGGIDPLEVLRDK